MNLLRPALSLALCASLAQPSIALGAMVANPCEGGTAAEELPDVSTIGDDEKLNWAKKLYLEAKNFHDEGNYYCSVIKYEQAYTYAPDKHLFAYNLGVDAWELKDCARVKHYMQLFMVNDTENDDLRKDAKRILDEANESPDCVTQAGGGGGGGGGGGSEPESSGAPIEDTEEAPGLDSGGSDSVDIDAPPKKKTSGLLIGGVALAVLGLGAAGGGAAVLFMGKGKHDEITDANSTTNSTGFAQGFWDQEKADSAKTLGTVGPILLGAGGAMLAGGIALIVMDRGNKKKGKGAYATTGAKPRLTGFGATPLRGGGGAASMTFRF